MLPPARDGSRLRTSWVGAKRMIHQLLRDGSEESARKVLALVHSDDDRVAYMAATQILDRTLGRVTDQPQAGGDNETNARLALERLSVDQLRALIDAVRAGAVKAADGVIEGDVVG